MPPFRSINAKSDPNSNNEIKYLNTQIVNTMSIKLEKFLLGTTHSIANECVALLAMIAISAAQSSTLIQWNFFTITPNCPL